MIIKFDSTKEKATLAVTYDLGKEEDKNLREVIDVFEYSTLNQNGTTDTHEISKNPTDVIFYIITLLSNLDALTEKQRATINDDVTTINNALQQHLLTLIINEREINPIKKAFFIQDLMNFYETNGGKNTDKIFKTEKKPASPSTFFEKKEYVSLGNIIKNMLTLADKDRSSGAYKTLDAIFGSVENTRTFLNNNSANISPSEPSSPRSPASPGK